MIIVDKVKMNLCSLSLCVNYASYTVHHEYSYNGKTTIAVILHYALIKVKHTFVAID